MPVRNSDTKVVTEEVRLSYVHLFEAWSNDPDIPAKFSCVLLIPKKAKKTLAALEKAREAATASGRPAIVATLRISTRRTPKGSGRA